jgi:DNA-binding response OmpR family regulator
MSKEKKILVIDDSSTNNVLLEAVLSTKGYGLFVTYSVPEAFKVMSSNEVDLVLLDLLMPEYSGFDFLLKKNEFDQYKNIPVIVVSAANDQKNKIKAKEFGAIDFIEKPIDLTLLMDKIEKILK